MSFPPPNATYSEVQAWEAAQRDERLQKIAPVLDRLIEGAVNRPRKPRGACSSCWELGHRRGDKACPNYDSPVRWRAHGKVWKPVEAESSKAAAKILGELASQAAHEAVIKRVGRKA